MTKEHPIKLLNHFEKDFLNIPMPINDKFENEKKFESEEKFLESMNLASSSKNIISLSKNEYQKPSVEIILPTKLSQQTPYYIKYTLLMSTYQELNNILNENKNFIFYICSLTRLNKIELKNINTFNLLKNAFEILKNTNYIPQDDSSLNYLDLCISIYKNIDITKKLNYYNKYHKTQFSIDFVINFYNILISNGDLFKFFSDNYPNHISSFISSRLTIGIADLLFLSENPHLIEYQKHKKYTSIADSSNLVHVTHILKNPNIENIYNTIKQFKFFNYQYLITFAKCTNLYELLDYHEKINPTDHFEVEKNFWNYYQNQFLVSGVTKNSVSKNLYKLHIPYDFDIDQIITDLKNKKFNKYLPKIGNKYDIYFLNNIKTLILIKQIDKTINSKL